MASQDEIHKIEDNQEPTQVRDVNDSDLLQILVKKSSKYIGPPEIANCYLMRSSPRGNALIINNEYFDGTTAGDEKKHREGSEIDGNNLERLFSELSLEV